MGERERFPKKYDKRVRLIIFYASTPFFLFLRISKPPPLPPFLPTLLPRPCNSLSFLSPKILVYLPAVIPLMLVFSTLRLFLLCLKYLLKNRPKFPVLPLLFFEPTFFKKSIDHHFCPC